MGNTVRNKYKVQPKRHWLKLAWRSAGLLLRPGNRTAEYVSASYDRIAPGYDETWTTHMRYLTAAMLDRLAPAPDSNGCDLTCGTGFATGELARRTDKEAIGVDASSGMLAVAGETHPDCTFIQADALEFLRSQPADSFDVITCCWGLGYTRPFAVLRQIARVLAPGGRVGIIDNSLFSLSEVMRVSLVTFAECPEALVHTMKVRFLPGARTLATLMRLAGLRVDWRDDGEKTYHVDDGKSAIERMTATGAAAGFEFAAGDDYRDAIFTRFAELLDQRYADEEGVPITHRYLAAIGHKRS